MSDQATYKAALAARHAAADAMADAALVSAKAAIAAGIAAISGGAPVATTSFDVIEAAEQIIPFTDAASVSLNIPAGAVGAIVYCVMDTGFESSGVLIGVDGLDPTAASKRLLHEQAMSVGMVPDVPEGDTGILVNFRAIAKTGETGSISVTYYQKV